MLLGFSPVGLGHCFLLSAKKVTSHPHALQLPQCCCLIHYLVCCYCGCYCVIVFVIVVVCCFVLDLEHFLLKNHFTLVWVGFQEGPNTSVEPTIPNMI